MVAEYLCQQPTLRQKRELMKKWFLSASCRFIFGAFVVVFGVMYVAQTNAISTKGYTMNDIERRIQALKQQNQKLEFEIATHRSMRSIQSRLSNLNLVATDNVKYVTLTGSSVARR
ncbi:MAG: hypothetical protein A2921_02030 [Candidatus Magasanikbacteria bacterium RIFCSPLOWO2_01_FULL_43_20b]|uniref:Cell division protein FtsL n=1 Tax=Candidatus Magasanikbacteria bacterium RIFCSPLOWO2_12_FULL_43_12 TaxID=1798692 RepID=A0A1F6MR15_9BACT|nr:MAG: hypothetical protein A3I93_02925 [Candidatus Magasanikbacteria bacterium RIFCSPLOWO2_02_FULL_43_22]OGH73669.1 MAG: hypothetical protein A2921_02030 [Candidatus Magasanikbacteria bacterium RIFCSPLOWO2_01_FULL_43_20b]OGH73950.1 MAG: hypothetical protein A3G00_03530 [Candidatus Magasanikbacteria bacterium RIFCSPLOWO2_12_FULL_43_12]